ncbi:MAG: hypothetical protein R2854_11860 [Caldilineaceae bacterium]
MNKSVARTSSYDLYGHSGSGFLDFLSAFVLGLVGRLHHAAGGLPAVTGGLPELRHDDAEQGADDKKERFYHVIAVLGDRRISWPLIILKSVTDATAELTASPPAFREGSLAWLLHVTSDPSRKTAAICGRTTSRRELTSALLRATIVRCFWHRNGVSKGIRNHEAVIYGRVAQPFSLTQPYRAVARRSRLIQASAKRSQSNRQLLYVLMVASTTT